MPELVQSFYVYRITVKDKSVRDDLFGPVLATKGLETRHRTINKERVTLRHFEKRGARILGTMYRSQVSAVQDFLSDKHGHDRPIPLNQEDEEGITGKTHFLYVPEYDILVLQSGRRRVGPGMLGKYLCQMAGIRYVDVEINATMTPSQYQKFLKMKDYAAVTITMEAPDRGEALKEHDVSDIQLIKTAAQSGAFNITLKYTRGRDKKNWLNPEWVRQHVKNLLKLHDDSAVTLTSVDVKGVAAIDDSLDEVDLIRDRMKLQREVAYDDRGFSTADCYRACEEVYDHFENDIATMYDRRH